MPTPAPVTDPPDKSYSTLAPSGEILCGCIRVYVNVHDCHARPARDDVQDVGSVRRRVQVPECESSDGATIDYARLPPVEMRCRVRVDVERATRAA